MGEGPLACGGRVDPAPGVSSVGVVSAAWVLRACTVRGRPRRETVRYGRQGPRDAGFPITRTAGAATALPLGLVAATPGSAPVIVGGTETRVNEFPWMLGLVAAGTGSLCCGAALIADQYALTAAHCVVDRDISTVGVLAGEDRKSVV